MANFDPNNPAELAAALEILNAPLGNVTNFDEYQAAYTARLDQLGLVDLPLTDPKETGALFGTSITSAGALQALASPETQAGVKELLKNAAENPVISPTVEITPLSDEDTAALFAEAENAPPEIPAAEEVDPEPSIADATNESTITSPETTFTQLSDEDAAALFAEAEDQSTIISPEVEITPLSDEDAAALFAEAEDQSTIISPEVEFTPLSDEDAAALFAEAEDLPPSGPAYDDEGNLMPGYELDEDNNPVYVGFDTPIAEPVEIDPAQGPAYDDEGNLQPGWSVDENNNPVYIGPDYIEPTDDGLPEGVGRIEPDVPDTPVDLSQADIAEHGPAYDDEGNINPGWTTDEEGNPRWVGGDFVEPSTQESADASRAENAAKVVSDTEDAQRKATEQDLANFEQNSDWRVRLTLAPNAKYLFNAKNAGILAPLMKTNGVIFPYSPQIQLSYNANYEPTDLTHTNYKHYQYKNSDVGQVQISAEFTAQDTEEANYVLAVIHFFRSVTKMFYGQDNNPPNGVPPPLCYLSGYGPYQFDNHPLAITNFSYSLPTDVDYIRAGAATQSAGVNLSAYQYKVNTYVPSLLRLSSSGLNPGGLKNQPKFTSLSNKEATYVPTKLTISLTCVPVVTRRDVSNNFSFEKYATGELLRGSRRKGGGIW